MYTASELRAWGESELIKEILDTALDGNEDCDFEYYASW